MTAFDPIKIRSEFPTLDQTVNDKPLVYLDNAATSQKPKAVLGALERYYTRDNANELVILRSPPFSNPVRIEFDIMGGGSLTPVHGEHARL